LDLFKSTFQSLTI